MFLVFLFIRKKERASFGDLVPLNVRKSKGKGHKNVSKHNLNNKSKN